MTHPARFDSLADGQDPLMAKPEDWQRAPAFTSSHHALGWYPEESESIRQMKSGHPDRFQQGFSIIGRFPQVDWKPNRLRLRCGVETVVLFGFARPDHCGCLSVFEDSGKIRMIALGTRRLAASGTDRLRFIKVIEFEPALPTTHNFTPHSV